MANKVSPITLQNNDVAQLGAQGNSIIAHSNGLMSIRAAGSNENTSVNPFDDDCSGIYASPGGLSLNTQATQTNYQTVNTGNDNNNIVVPTKPTPGKAIIMGDSQTPAIKSYSKKLQPLTKDGVLWKSGWFLKDLKKAVEAYSKDETIEKVFINIGTNGGYSKSDDVKGLVNSVKTTFPNSTLYVIEGSTGWGGVTNIQRETIDSYYNKFTSLGVTKLQNAIGDVRLDDRVENGKTIDPNKDDQHPNTKTPGMALIGREIDSIIGTAVSPTLPSVDIKPLPSPTPKPSSAAVVEQPADEFEDITFLPDREDSPIKIIYPQDALHTEGGETEFTKIIQEIIIPDRPPGSPPAETTQIDKNGVTTGLVMYMQHQQGPAGAPALLYYTFIEPKSIVGNPNKFGKFNLSGNMYGFYLYDGYSTTNVGFDFFKLFPEGKSTTSTQQHTRYINKPKYSAVGYYNTSYFTPTNFLKYYIYKWDAVYKAANKPGACPSKIETILSKYAKKWGVPLDLMKAVCKMESGFIENNGNGIYEGLFALGRPIWDQYYKNNVPFSSARDAELNADLGGKVLKDKLDEANNLINKYVK
jgi:hypothetical protein